MTHRFRLLRMQGRVRRHWASLTSCGLAIATIAAGACSAPAVRSDQSDRNTTTVVEREAAPTSGTAAAGVGRGLPPVDTDGIARDLDPVIAELNLRVSHATLVEDRDGRYESSEYGNHLAIYLEPVPGAVGSIDYQLTLLASLQRLGPEVLERWPGLTSFDICQERPGSGEASPETVTQVKIPRAAISPEELAVASVARLQQLEAAGTGVTLVLDAAER
jgi:hypothetical protein